MRPSFVALIAFLLNLSSVSLVTATSYYFPKFGTPIVVNDRLVFTGPGWESSWLICIGKNDGKKLWEIKDGTNVLNAWFALDGRLVITTGSEIKQCEVSSGRLTPLYRSDYSRCSLRQSDKGKILLTGEKNDVDFVSCVDSSNWRKVWETAGVRQICAEGKEVLLCTEGSRKSTSGGGYALEGSKLAGVSKVDGKVLWRIPMSVNAWTSEGVASGEYFVVALGGTVHCIKQLDGSTVKSLKVHDSELISPDLSLKDGQVLMWSQKGRDVFSGHIVHSLSVPMLEKKEIAETDWYSGGSHAYDDVLIGVTVGRVDAYQVSTRKKLWQGGQWNWTGIHDGYIYFSEMSPDHQHASVNRIQVKTGERKKLYEELLATKLRKKDK